MEVSRRCAADRQLGILTKLQPSHVIGPNCAGSARSRGKSWASVSTMSRRYASNSCHPA